MTSRHGVDVGLACPECGAYVPLPDRDRSALERVAQALYEDELVRPRNMPWEDVPYIHREPWRQKARTVLAALREGTP